MKLPRGTLLKSVLNKFLLPYDVLPEQSKTLHPQCIHLLLLNSNILMSFRSQLGKALDKVKDDAVDFVFDSYSASKLRVDAFKMKKKDRNVKHREGHYTNLLVN